MGHENKNKAPWWDVVGMMLTLDKRLLIAIPTLFMMSYFGSKLS